METAAKYWTATRWALAFVFLWAFFDKLFGLGFATCRDRTTGEYLGIMCEKAWLAGGSPTTGFLSGANGWFHSFFNTLATYPGIVNFLFMIGLLGIGLALLFGVAMGLASYSGATLLVLMWLAELPLDTNPIIDDHIVYALVLLAMYHAGMKGSSSIAHWWRERGFVKGKSLLE